MRPTNHGRLSDGTRRNATGFRSNFERRVHKGKGARVVLELLHVLCVFQAERSHPGLAEEFLDGLLRAEGASVDLPEALLRLACHDGDHYTIPSEEKEFVLLNEGARGGLSLIHIHRMHTHNSCTCTTHTLTSVLATALKVKLSHIPDQIQDRSQFLKIIRSDIHTSTPLPNPFIYPLL